MKKDRIARKARRRTLSGCIVLGLCTVLLAGLTIPAMAADSGAPAVNATASAPEGYRKANYKVVDDTLEYYRDKKPSKDVISRDEAAERGAQMLWELFGADLEGKTIYMGYNPENESYPQPTWSGDVRDGSSRTPQDDCITFSIDAVTGERLNAAMGRTIPAKVSLGLDSKLAKNPGKYLDLAEKFAKDHSLLGESLDSAKYNCQGYSGNDPDISIDAVGENGAIANLVFSRYDQTLKAVSYPKYEQISREAHAKYLRSLGIEE